MTEIPVTPEKIEQTLRDLDRKQAELLKKYGVPSGALNTILSHGVTVYAHWDKYRARVAVAKTIPELAKASAKVEDAMMMTCLYLWGQEVASGLETSHTLSKKAEKAEKLADHLDKMGKASNAASQRNRAELLRRRAAGEEVTIPTRKNGTVAQVRALFESMRGKPRKEAIEAAVASGVNRNTANTQYYRWSKGIE